VHMKVYHVDLRVLLCQVVERKNGLASAIVSNWELKWLVSRRVRLCAVA
jgi:hypothetical protein